MKTNFSRKLALVNNPKEAIGEAFSGKGPKNSGDPYFSKDSLTPKGSTISIREQVRKLSMAYYNKMDKYDIYNVRDASLIASMSATMFGRNQTKGWTYKFDPENNTFKVIQFEAAGRVIYGVDRFTNNILSLLYYPISLHLRKLPEFVAMTDSDTIKKDIKETNRLDRQYKI